MPEGERVQGQKRLVRSEQKVDWRKKLPEELPQVLSALMTVRREVGYFPSSDDVNTVIAAIVGEQRADGVRRELVNVCILIVDGERDGVVYLDAVQGQRVKEALEQGLEVPLPHDLRERLEAARSVALTKRRDAARRRVTVTMPLSCVMGHAALEMALDILKTERGYPDTRELPPIVVRRVAKLVHPRNSDDRSQYTLWYWAQKGVIKPRMTQEKKPRYAAIEVLLINPTPGSERRSPDIHEPSREEIRSMLQAIIDHPDEQIVAEFAAIGMNVRKKPSKEDDGDESMPVHTRVPPTSPPTQAPEPSPEKFEEAEASLEAIDRQIRDLLVKRRALRNQEKERRIQRAEHGSLVEQERAALHLIRAFNQKADELEAKADAIRAEAQQQRSMAKVAEDEQAKLRSRIEELERQLGTVGELKTV